MEINMQSNSSFGINNVIIEKFNSINTVSRFHNWLGFETNTTK